MSDLIVALLAIFTIAGFLAIGAAVIDKDARLLIIALIVEAILGSLFVAAVAL